MLRQSIIEWDKVSSDQIEGRYRTSEPAMPGLFAELFPVDGELQWRPTPDAESMPTLAVYVERTWGGRDAMNQEYPAGDIVTVAYLQNGDVAQALVPSGQTLTSHNRMATGPGGYVYPVSDPAAAGGRARLLMMAGAAGEVTAPRRVVVRVVG